MLYHDRDVFSLWIWDSHIIIDKNTMGLLKLYILLYQSTPYMKRDAYVVQMEKKNSK